MMHTIIAIILNFLKTSPIEFSQKKIVCIYLFVLDLYDIKNGKRMKTSKSSKEDEKMAHLKHVVYICVINFTYMYYVLVFPSLIISF